MSLDLYLYYTDLVHETLNEMEAGEWPRKESDIVGR
jgi:hypothetical protein